MTDPRFQNEWVRSGYLLVLFGCLVDLTRETENQPYLLLTLGPCLCPILHALRKECTGDLGLGMDESRHSLSPSSRSIFFIFMQFLEKVRWKIAWRFPVWGILDPPLSCTYLLNFCTYPCNPLYYHRRFRITWVSHSFKINGWAIHRTGLFNRGGRGGDGGGAVSHTTMLRDPRSVLYRLTLGLCIRNYVLIL